MNNSKLVNILRTFSKNELKEFEKFISSPFFNRGRNYMPFLNQLRKFHPKFDNEKMTQEYIYSKMYPGKKFNKQIIWNMSSSMMNMAEEFLMQVSLRKNRFIKEQQISEEFLERRLSAYYNKKLDDMEKALDKMGVDDSYFRYKTELETGRMSYHFLEDTQHLLSEHILRKGEYAILNFMRDISDTIGSLRVAYNMYNIKFDVNLPQAFVENLQMEKLVEYAGKHKFKYASIMAMYYRTIMLAFEFDNTEHFFILKKLFEQNYNLFSRGEKYMWAAELTNYCVQRINKGDDDFKKTIFEIDKFKLKEGIVFPEKYLPKLSFIQILSNALSADEIEWSKNYIEEYVPRLSPSHQKAMHAFAYALVYFRIKDFDKVLENLGKIKFTDAMDKFYARSIYIRTYYELNETEALLYYIASTKQFLAKNSSLAEDFRNNYNRFLNCLNKIMTAKENNDDFGLNRIKKTIQEDKTLWYAEWMLEKIEEINKKGGF